MFHQDAQPLHPLHLAARCFRVCFLVIATKWHFQAVLTLFTKFKGMNSVSSCLCAWERARAHRDRVTHARDRRNAACAGRNPAVSARQPRTGAARTQRGTVTSLPPGRAAPWRRDAETPRGGGEVGEGRVRGGRGGGEGRGRGRRGRRLQVPPRGPNLWQEEAPSLGALHRHSPEQFVSRRCFHLPSHVVHLLGVGCGGGAGTVSTLLVAPSRAVKVLPDFLTEYKQRVQQGGRRGHPQPSKCDRPCPRRRGS